MGKMPGRLDSVTYILYRRAYRRRCSFLHHKVHRLVSGGHRSVHRDAVRLPADCSARRPGWDRAMLSFYLRSSTPEIRLKFPKGSIYFSPSSCCSPQTTHSEHAYSPRVGRNISGSRRSHAPDNDQTITEVCVWWPLPLFSLCCCARCSSQPIVARIATLSSSRRRAHILIPVSALSCPTSKTQYPLQ